MHANKIKELEAELAAAKERYNHHHHHFNGLKSVPPLLVLLSKPATREFTLEINSPALCACMLSVTVRHKPWMSCAGQLCKALSGQGSACPHCRAGAVRT